MACSAGAGAPAFETVSQRPYALYFPPFPNPTTIFSALDRINRIYRIEEMTAQSAEIFCLGTKGEFSSLRSKGRE